MCSVSRVQYNISNALPVGLFAQRFGGRSVSFTPYEQSTASSALNNNLAITTPAVTDNGGKQPSKHGATRT